MAFTNKDGIKISYECSDLIEELEQDIAEFGDDLVVNVVTETRQDIKLYKDYNFIDDDPETDFKLKPTEKLETILATKLLAVYKLENELM